MSVSRRLRFCRYCGGAAPEEWLSRRRTSESKLTVDHVVPIALGGGDEPANLVACCVDCNSGKSATPPGAPLGDDVAADALRWSRAMALAASLAEDSERQEQGWQDEWRARWDKWNYGSKDDPHPVPLPSTWRQSLIQFGSAGIDIAMASQATADQTWRYFCGVVWRKVSRLQETAGGMLDAEDV